MKPTTAKILMRVVGTLAGLLGLVMLPFGFMFYHSITERNVWMILLPVCLQALAAYFIYVAYLVWFRFSPLAVRHICGTLALYVLALVTKLFDSFFDLGMPWEGFASLGCFVAAYVAYDVASVRLSRWLFSERVPRVQS